MVIKKVVIKNSSIQAMVWREILFNLLRNRSFWAPAGLLREKGLFLKEEIENFAKTNRTVLAVILFGSRTRGDWNGFSDWDVLFMVSNSEKCKGVVFSFAFELSEKLGEMVHPLIEEVGQKVDPILAQNILEEGKVVYVREELGRLL